jgi:hypothetical protein
MSRNNNDANWKKMFAEFHAKHKDPKGNLLKFTPYFNRALEAMIDDPQMCSEARLISWQARYGWGNDSDYTVDRPGGSPIGQKEFAARIGVKKQRASEIFDLVEASGYSTHEGHKVYPSDDPGLPPKSLQNDQKSAKGRTFPPFKAWCEQVWNVRSSTDFQELQSAEATIRKIKIVRLGEYRKARRSRTFGEPYPYKVFNSLTGETNTPSSSVSDVPAPEPTTTNAEPLVQAGTATARAREPEAMATSDPVRETARQYATVDPAGIQLLRKACAPHSDNAICAGIHAKGRQATKRDNPFGFLLTAVPNWLKDPENLRTTPAVQAAHRAPVEETRQQKIDRLKAKIKVCDEIAANKEKYRPEERETQRKRAREARAELERLEGTT